MKNTILLVCFFLLSGCNTEEFGDVSNIKIKGTGYEGEKAGKLCGMFKLNKSQVKTYFKKTKKIDSTEAHYQHDYYSCWVHGDFVYKGNNCMWSIDVGGLANIQCGGKEYITYCKNCENFMLEQIS